MPTLHVAREPRLGPVLAPVLGDGSFVVVDVGAGGGVEAHWAALGRAVRHVAFEPDAAECARLNAAGGAACHPYALAGRTGRRTFYARDFGARCSFFPVPRRALPQPYCWDYRAPGGRPFPGPAVAGKPQLGDALYLRDVVDDLRTGRRAYGLRDVPKACCLYELYGLPDYAAELPLEVGGEARLDLDRLLDLLVPEVKGERQSYREHVRSLAERPERFRPAETTP